MKLLLDTHLLLWAASEPDQLPDKARQLIADTGNNLLFSAASMWEIAIKSTLGRDDFKVDPRVLRRGLLDNGYIELEISSEHAVTTNSVPPIHKDPFDRMLIAQAMVEGIILLTSDAAVAQYPGSVQKV